MGSYDLMVAQVAQNNGVNHGHAIGVQHGKAIGKRQGKTEGRNNGIQEMQPWVEHAKSLEEMLQNGGLDRLWKNKIIFTTKRAAFTKSPINDRRLLFLSMLAHAEYHQRHVVDPIELVGSVSILVEEDIARSKAISMNFNDSMAAFMAQADSTVESDSAKLKRTRIKLAISEKRLEEMEKRVTKTTEGAKRVASTMRHGQKDENMDGWIAKRVESLSKSVKYSTKDGIIPDAGSLGNAATSKQAGYEIAEDKFDIVTDTKKYLGETRDSFGY